MRPKAGLTYLRPLHGPAERLGSHWIFMFSATAYCVPDSHINKEEQLLWYPNACMPPRVKYFIHARRCQSNRTVTRPEMW